MRGDDGESPPGFERQLVQSGEVTTLVAANSVDNTLGGMGSLSLSEILGEFSAELRANAATSVAGIDSQISRSFPVIDTNRILMTDHS